MVIVHKSNLRTDMRFAVLAQWWCSVQYRYWRLFNISSLVANLTGGPKQCGLLIVCLFWFVQGKRLVKSGRYLGLQTTIDHHGFFMYSDHYAASVYCCEKTFSCNDDKITVCDINHSRGSSTTYVMIYKLLVEWVFITRILRVGNIFSHGAGTFGPAH